MIFQFTMGLLRNNLMDRGASVVLTANGYSHITKVLSGVIEILLKRFTIKETGPCTRHGIILPET